MPTALAAYAELQRFTTARTTIEKLAASEGARHEPSSSPRVVRGSCQKIQLSEAAMSHRRVRSPHQRRIQQVWAAVSIAGQTDPVQSRVSQKFFCRDPCAQAI